MNACAGAGLDDELVAARRRDSRRRAILTARPAALKRSPTWPGCAAAMPYPWQWDVADVAGELADDGVGFRYPVVVLSVPRRAGKTHAEPGRQPGPPRHHR